MTTEELQQIYDIILFIKDNILPIVLSALAAIIAAISGVSTMVSAVQGKFRKAAETTNDINQETKKMVGTFSSQYKTVDDKLNKIISTWEQVEAKYNKEFASVSDIHKQLAEIKLAVKMIATEDPELVKKGVSAEVVKAVGK